MAYNSTNMMVGRGQVNCEATTTAPAYHSYRTTDTLSDVLMSGYFSDNFGFGEGTFQQGDLLWIQTSTEKSLFWLSDVTPVPVLSENLTPANVVAEEDYDGSIDLLGPWSGTQTTNFSAVKQGSKVTINFGIIEEAHTVNALISGTITLPDGWLPAASVWEPVNVINNSIFAPGFILIGSGGNVQIGTYQASYYFTAGNVGFYGFCITYLAE